LFIARSDIDRAISRSLINNKQIATLHLLPGMACMPKSRSILGRNDCFIHIKQNIYSIDDSSPAAQTKRGAV